MSKGRQRSTSQHILENGKLLVLYCAMIIIYVFLNRFKVSSFDGGKALVITRLQIKKNCS